MRDPQSTDNFEMSLDNYIRSKVIGKGSYGEVWLAKLKGDKKQVCKITSRFSCSIVICYAVKLFCGMVFLNDGLGPLSYLSGV